MDEPAFKQELERQQKAVSDQALLGMTAQNVTAAVERLAELINDSDKRLVRLACKDMLELRLEYVQKPSAKGEKEGKTTKTESYKTAVIPAFHTLYNPLQQTIKADGGN